VRLLLTPKLIHLYQPHLNHEILTNDQIHSYWYQW
jgi:hypothetical protein